MKTNYAKGRSFGFFAYIKIATIKLLFLPFYFLDYLYDFLQYMRFSSTQRIIVNNDELITTNAQITLHKIQKSRSFPKRMKNRGNAEWIKLQKIKSEYSGSIKSKVLSDLVQTVDFSSDNQLVQENSSVKGSTDFEKLVLSRKSIRNYSDKKIDEKTIQKILDTAKYCPSVCNRQTWRLHSYSDATDIKKLLHYQNGNNGWGYLIPNLLIVTYDLSYFTTSSERNQGWIDAGMFSMNIILAAQSMGLSTCCLNQSNYFFKDITVHQLGNIPKNERIVMMIALGYASEKALYACSQRYENSFFLTTH